MPISKELFLAILSVDSYNRGFNAVIDDLGVQALGTASIGDDSKRRVGFSPRVSR